MVQLLGHHCRSQQGMANTVLKTKWSALLMEEHRDPTVLESCKKCVEIISLVGSYSSVQGWNCSQLTQEVNTVKSLTRLYIMQQQKSCNLPSHLITCGTRNWCKAFSGSSSDGVRCPPSSTAPTLCMRGSPLLSLSPHPCVNFMLLPGQWNKLMLHRGDRLCILFSCGCTVSWPEVILHQMPFMCHRLPMSVRCGRRWLLSCGSTGASSYKYREPGFYKYLLLQEKGEVWWLVQVVRKQTTSVSSLHWEWSPKLQTAVQKRVWVFHPWYFHAPLLFKGFWGNTGSLCHQECHRYQVPQFGLSGTTWLFIRMLDIAGPLLTNQMSPFP